MVDEAQLAAEESVKRLKEKLHYLKLAYNTSKTNIDQEKRRKLHELEDWYKAEVAKLDAECEAAKSVAGLLRKKA